MYMLNKNQVELIEADVENARITLDHLSQELVDHICCEVENMMYDGKSFDEAYMMIKEQTGIRVLRNIQENTLYLIDKNYLIMKTTMKITGTLSLAMLGLGTVFRIMHWPGADQVLVLGFIILCLIAFPSAIYLNYYDKKETRKLLLNLSILLGGIAFMAGILFKVMHWQGANVLLLTGWTLILALFLPVLLYTKLKEPGTGMEKFTYVMGTFALIVFELATLFKIFHWPGASALMLSGSFLLVSVFLPMYTYIRFRQPGKATGQFIFIVTLAMYAVVMSALISIRPAQSNSVQQEPQQVIEQPASTNTEINHIKPTPVEPGMIDPSFSLFQLIRIKF